MQPVANARLNHYRIINADYVLVGAIEELFPMAQRLGDKLRNHGLRAGALSLHDESRIPQQAVALLAQSRAIGVLSPSGDARPLAQNLARALRDAAAHPEWPHPGRIPRVYAALWSEEDRRRPIEDRLAELVKVMHTYARPDLLLAPERLAQPEGGARRLSAVA